MVLRLHEEKDFVPQCLVDVASMLSCLHHCCLSVMFAFFYACQVHLAEALWLRWAACRYPWRSLGDMLYSICIFVCVLFAFLLACQVLDESRACKAGGLPGLMRWARLAQAGSG